MGKAADIGDEKSLKAWLEGQPREASIAIAASSLLRLLPLWTAYCLSYDGRNRSLQPLPILRALFLTSIAPSSLTSVIKSVIKKGLPALVHSVDHEAEGVDNLLRVTKMSDVAGVFDTHELQAWVARSSHAVLTAAQLENDMQVQSLAETIADAVTRPGKIDAPAWVSLGTLYEDNEAGYLTVLLKDARMIDEGDGIANSPLWPATNPLQDKWTTTRKDWSRPGSPYAFWLRWYECLLAPEAHPPLPPDLLRAVALIDEEFWTQGAEAVAKEIARIEEQYAEDDDLHASLAALPPASQSAVKATKQAMERHRADLPPTFDAILGFIALEVDRLQARNSRDSDDKEESNRQIQTLTTIYRAVVALQALVPKGETMPLADAEKAEKLGRAYLNKFKAWPRKNADEMVDNTYRFALVGLTSLTLPMIGIPAAFAFGGAMVFFGGKTVVDAAKVAKDLTFPKATP